jgi:hypothetical protein
MNKQESQIQKTLGSAVDEIVAALEPLDDSSRRIAVMAACQKFGIELLGQAASGAARGVLQTSPRQETASVPAPAAEATVDIRTFAQEKNPTTATERVALVAYYLSELAPSAQRKREIDRNDLENYFRQALFPRPKRLEQALVDAHHAGYLDRVAEGKYRLNAVGYNLVAHNLPRESDSAAGGRRRKAPRSHARRKKATAK